MLVLKSPIDGSRVIIGNFVGHFLLFLTLIIAVRPPEYEDQTKTRKAKLLYSFLVIYHFAFTVMDFLFIDAKGLDYRTKFGVLIMIPILLVIILCNEWLFLPGEDRE